MREATSWGRNLESNIVDWQAAKTEALEKAGSEAELRDVLAAAARELGFDYCAYGLRTPLPLSNPKLVMVSNYTSAWQARYVQQNYLAIDPTVAHGIRSVVPLVWTEELFKANPTFWADAHAHGLNAGWAQSTYDAHGAVGMLTLARSHEVLSESELRNSSMRMSWLAQGAHQAMSRLAAAVRPVAPIELTPREIEVLRWTADGKTSGEVGDIMGISERTVNFHVNNCLEKLGAVNKTAGVIKAVMLRLL